MTYSIHRFTAGTKSYIGYETMEDYNYKDFFDTRAALFEERPDLADLDLSYKYLRLEVEEAELWKSLRGFMDAYNTVENGYNTEEEYEKVSAHIIKQNLKAATQNQVDSSDGVGWHEPISNENDIVPNPHKSRQVITIGKNDLISLAAEHGFVSDTIVLYLYLNVIPGDQITDATLEQAAKDLDLTIGTIKESYNNLIEYGFIEELHIFQVKRI